MNAEKTKVGSYVSLGGGYTAYVENTPNGKRWVIRDADKKTVPNAPPNHKYLSDAKNYYNQYLRSPTSNPQKESPKTSPESEILQEANENQIDLTKDRATEESDFQTLYNFIRAIARKTGESPEEILKKIIENPTLLPDSLREKVSAVDPITGEKTYHIDDRLLNRLYDKVEGKDLLGDLTSTIENKQGQRRDIYEELRDLPDKGEDRNRSTLEAMVDPEMGMESYQDIWGRASEETKENLTPQGIHQLDTMRGLDDLKQRGAEQADLYHRLAPGEDFSINWNDNPSYGRARDIYNEDFKPNYAYGSVDPHNQREHQLASSGHAKGSSSLEGNEEAKKRAMHREDLENIFNIQRMLEAEHRGRGETLKQITGLGDAERHARGEPIQESENLLGKQFGRDFDQTYKQNEFQKEIAEGGMSLNTAEMQDASNLYNLLKAQNQEGYQEERQLDNEIYNYLMHAEQLKKGGVQDQKQLEQMEQNLWANRVAVINSIKALALQERSLDMQEKAKELERSQNDRNAFLKVLGTVAVAGLAMAVPGGSALMGVATLAPGIAQMADFGGKGVPNQGWFNSKGSS